METMPADTFDKLIPIAKKLMSKAEFDDADAILAAVKSVESNHYPAFETYALCAAHRRDWDAAAFRWREAQIAFPDNPKPTFMLASTLQALHRFNDAEDLLRVAMEKFPANLDIAREYAALPMARGRVEEAVTRLAALRERFPSNLEGYVTGAQALSKLGRFQEAEALLEPLITQHPTNFHLNLQRAHIATSLGRWEEAFRRWDIMLRLSPNDQGIDVAIGEAITVWQHARQEGDPAAVHARLPDEIARRAGALATPAATESPGRLADRGLGMAFEGLGDRCEFGLVQRHFGAEPIGLLRWSGIETKHLITLLNSRFEGVGDPANTFVRVHEHTNEYFIGDNRFFYMHTFLKKTGEAEADMFDKFRKRIAYLKDELLTDLESGEKIFVYKPHVGQLTDAQADAIRTAFDRHYPASRIVLMRLAQQPGQSGTIKPLAHNAIWGYLSRFSENLDAKFIRYDEWRAVLQAATKHFGVRPE